MAIAQTIRSIFNTLFGAHMFNKQDEKIHLTPLKKPRELRRTFLYDIFMAQEFDINKAKLFHSEFDNGDAALNIVVDDFTFDEEKNLTNFLKYQGLKAEPIILHQDGEEFAVLQVKGKDVEQIIGNAPRGLMNKQLTDALEKSDKARAARELKRPNYINSAFFSPERK